MEKREASRLLCDFISGKKTAVARLEELSPADWANLTDWALRFRVEGLCYRAMKSPDLPERLFPDEIRNRFRNAYRNQATRNASLFFDAARVLGSLAENQLPVIALKGLALAKTVYGDIALRPMSDLDLLLQEEDLIRAGRILLALGYQQDFPGWESTLKIYHHLPPFKNKTGTIIELHWNIVTPDSPIKVDIGGLWTRACPGRAGDAEARIFSIEDIFLHVCIHACFDLKAGPGLIPFFDVAGLIKTSVDKINWSILIERASRWGGRKCVYLMLLLTRELLGVMPPERILSAIKPDDYHSAYFAGALDLLFYDASPSSQVMKRRIGKFQDMKKAIGLKGKVRAVLRGAFPTREYLARIYPVAVSSPKIYLVYVFRLRRLFSFCTRTFFRLFTSDREVANVIDQERRASAVSDWLFSK